MKTRTRLVGCALALAIPFTLLPATAAAADIQLRTAIDDGDGGLLDSIGDLLGSVLDPSEPADPEPTGTPSDPSPDPTDEPTEPPAPTPTPAPTAPAPTPHPTTPSTSAGGSTPPSSGGTRPAGSNVLREGVVPASADRGVLDTLVVDPEPAEERAPISDSTSEVRWGVDRVDAPVDASSTAPARGHDPALPTALGVSAAGLGVLAVGAVVLHRRLPRGAHRLEAAPRRGRHRTPGASLPWWPFGR